jgi:hypothetical protein
MTRPEAFALDAVNDENTHAFGNANTASRALALDANNGPIRKCRRT